MLLISSTLVIISLCICISNHHIIYLKYIQLLLKSKIKKIANMKIFICTLPLKNYGVGNQRVSGTKMEVDPSQLGGVREGFRQEPSD